MGANAQTTVPTFTAGQVLTAAQLNNSARTGVPVFATTVERDAAFGGAGEKTLAEGQLAYLESTNVVQYYDGAAWATVGPATASGLTFISTTTFTTVASVSLANSTFTSTYRNYRVMVSITANTTDDTALTLRLRAAGTDTTTAYYGAIFGIDHLSDTLRVSRSNNASALSLGALRTGLYDQVYNFDLIAPQIAAETQATGNAIATVPTTNVPTSSVFGMSQTSATQFDALTLLAAAGTMTGTIRVYGYSES